MNVILFVMFTFHGKTETTTTYVKDMETCRILEQAIYRRYSSKLFISTACINVKGMVL